MLRQQMRSWGRFYTGDWAGAADLSGQSIVEKTNVCDKDSGWQHAYTGAQIAAGVAAATAVGLMTYKGLAGIRFEFHFPHLRGPHRYPHIQKIKGPNWGDTLGRWPQEHPRWWPKTK